MDSLTTPVQRIKHRRAEVMFNRRAAVRGGWPTNAIDDILAELDRDLAAAEDAARRLAKMTGPSAPTER